LLRPLRVLPEREEEHDRDTGDDYAKQPEYEGDHDREHHATKGCGARWLAAVYGVLQRIEREEQHDEPQEEAEECASCVGPADDEDRVHRLPPLHRPRGWTIL